jgi:hypothetical protein
MTDNREPSPPAAAPGLAERLEVAGRAMPRDATVFGLSRSDMLEAADAFRANAPQVGEPQYVIPVGTFDAENPAITFAAHLSDPRSHAYHAWRNGNPNYLPVYIPGAPSGGAEQGGSDGAG